MLSRLRKLPWRVIIPWTLALAATAVAIAFYLQWKDLDDTRKQQAEVQTTAREFITALTNFSHETIEQDVEEIRSFAVGDFADEAATYFGDDGIAAIKEAQASSEAQIESLFVQAMDGDEASVFAVVSETISNSVSTDPQTDVLRLEVGMIETAQGWKVNRVDVFQAPGTGVIGGPAA